MSKRRRNTVRAFEPVVLPIEMWRHIWSHCALRECLLPVSRFWWQNAKPQITKLPVKDYQGPIGKHGALTLSSNDVEENTIFHLMGRRIPAMSSRLHHDSGWRITGIVYEDYRLWVNFFEARHSLYGRVCGDFEKEVLADSEEGFAHFYEHHTPEHWDYWDI